jgi:predicted dehydrogenase
MKTVIVGQGSIGKRHKRVLETLGADVITVSKHEAVSQTNFSTLEDALNQQTPDYVVVANVTSEHWTTLKNLDKLNFKGKVLVEKPLSLSLPSPKDLSANFQKNVFVGYHLRFHPLIQNVRELIKKDKILSINAYVGQDLRTWRPDRPYQDCYSSKKSGGGGVLRDLSHELDFLLWIAGPWKSVLGKVAKLSSLEIDVEDTVTAVFASANVPQINVSLNYTDKIVQRYFTVDCEGSTVRADFIGGTLQVNKDKKNFEVERDLAYSKMHSALMEGNTEDLCTLEQGIEVMSLIEAIEASSKNMKWINR